MSDLNRLKTENQSSYVNAINEIVGKRIIANAIGEPLNSLDKWSDMESDINGLLSTFKTNMMNNGIVVESGDKFKSLIDKIATMVEEGSGKGIQFVRKDITLPRGSKWLQVDDLGFEANIVMYNIDTSHVLYDDTVGYDQLVLYPIGGSVGSAVYSSVSNFPGGMYINENGFRLPIFTAQYTESNTQTTVNKTITIIAIGVGEDDTTLRDSLASILQEEGVSVTEEDDMASLISKTDNQFNSLNTTITLLNNQVNSLTSELAGKVTPAGTAVAGDVLTGKTFINSTGQTITGTMANNGTKTITPKASAQTLGAGYYDKITINGDADLVAANIVSGKNIFGVTGTATGSISGAGTPNAAKNFKYQRYNDSTGASATANANWNYLEFNLNFTPNTIVLEGTYSTSKYIVTYIKGLTYLTMQLVASNGGIINYCVYADSLVVLGNNKFHIPTPASLNYNYYIC